jgi:hypothetical protein
VQIGKLRVKTDEYARMLPQFYKGRDGKPAFAVDSFYDVISGKIPASQIRRQDCPDRRHSGRRGRAVSGAGYPACRRRTIAHITSSILGEHFIVQPGWGGLGAFGAFSCWWRPIWWRLCRACRRVRRGVCDAGSVRGADGAEFGLLSGAPCGSSWCSRRPCWSSATWR